MADLQFHSNRRHSAESAGGTAEESRPLQDRESEGAGVGWKGGWWVGSIYRCWAFFLGGWGWCGEGRGGGAQTAKSLSRNWALMQVWKRRKRSFRENGLRAVHSLQRGGVMMAYIVCVCVCVCVMCVRLTKRLRLYTGTCLQDERR